MADTQGTRWEIGRNYKFTLIKGKSESDRGKDVNNAFKQCSGLSVRGC